MRRGCEHFARLIESWDELPEAVSAALRHIQPEDSVIQTIFIPPQQYALRRSGWLRELPFGWRKTPNRTLTFSDGQITVVEGIDDLAVYVIPLANLIAIRRVTVLLQSYAELTWTGSNGVETILIEFNSVGARLVDHGLSHVRSVIAQRAAFPAPPDPVPVPKNDLPLKFYNYVKYTSLLPEEPVCAIAYEPAIRVPGVHLRPYISPNRTVVLSRDHLIVVQDKGPISRETPASGYQIEQEFYPRQHVCTMSFEPEPELTWLCVDLAHAETLRLPLLPTTADTLRPAVSEWLPGVYASTH